MDFSVLKNNHVTRMRNVFIPQFGAVLQQFHGSIMYLQERLLRHTQCQLYIKTQILNKCRVCNLFQKEGKTFV